MVNLVDQRLPLQKKYYEELAALRRLLEHPDFTPAGDVLYFQQYLRCRLAYQRLAEHDQRQALQ